MTRLTVHTTLLRSAALPHSRSLTTAAAAATPAVAPAAASTSSSSSKSAAGPMPARAKPQVAPAIAARQARLQRWEQKKKNDTLRRAIELYHITPHFLPTPDRVKLSKDAKESGATESPPPTEQEYDASLESAISGAILNNDTVSRSVSAVTPRGLTEYSRDLSNRAASTPSYGINDHESTRNTQEISQFASDLTQNTFMTKQEREAAAAAAAASASSSSSSSQSGKKARSTNSIMAQLQAFTDEDLEMYRRRHHAGGSVSLGGGDGSGSSFLGGGGGAGGGGGGVGSGERMSHMERMTPGNNPVYINQNLDSRSARVRDAIFGTVNGELPGLEVVRERIAEMQKQRGQRRGPEVKGDKKKKKEEGGSVAAAAKVQPNQADKAVEVGTTTRTNDNATPAAAAEGRTRSTA